MTELSPSDSPYDLILNVDSEAGGGTNILPLRLIRDGKPAYYPASSEPAERSERTISYENRGIGAGYSRMSEQAVGGIAYGIRIDSTQDGVITPAGEITELTMPAESFGGYIRDAFERAGHLYLLADRRHVLYWPGKAGSTIQVAVDLGVTATTQYAVAFNDRIYISLGANGTYGIYSFDGSNWLNQVTSGSNGTVTRLQMAKVTWMINDQLATGGLAGLAGLTDYFLVALSPDGLNFQICAADPFNEDNWSTTYPIGDSTYVAQRMVWSNRYVAVAKPDGVWSIDETGHAVNLTPWVEKVYHADNGSSVEYWNGAIWYATRMGLSWIPLTGERQDVAVFVQFGDGASNETPIFGFPRCLAPGHDRLWVGLYNGTDGYLMCVRLNREGRPVWHGAFAKYDGEIPTFIREVTTLAGHRWVLVGTHDGTNPHVYVQSLPQSGQPLVDYRQGTTHRFTTSWSVDWPTTNFESWSTKTGRRGTIVAGLLGSGNSLALKTAVDTAIDAGTYTEQATVSESPRSSFVFSGDIAEGVDFSFRVEGSNTTTRPIALRAVELRATNHPETVDVYTARVIVAKGQTLKGGSIDDETSPKTTLRALRALEAAGPIGMIDPVGDYHPAVKIEAGRRPTLFEDRATQQWYAVVDVTITILESAYHYDEDAFFDFVGTYI